MGSKPHEPRVFAALALNGVPIDVLAQRPSTTRGALYETPAEARRALQRIMDGRAVARYPSDELPSHRSDPGGYGRGDGAERSRDHWPVP
jgi:hypothetical protein